MKPSYPPRRAHEEVHERRGVPPGTRAAPQERIRQYLSLARLRKRVAFELFLRRLLAVAPNRWVLKGALALDFRLTVATRSTKDIDLGRDDDEQAATRDITAAQQLAMDDFFTFAATRTDELEDTDEFSAVRFRLTAQLAGRRLHRSGGGVRQSCPPVGTTTQ